MANMFSARRASIVLVMATAILAAQEPTIAPEAAKPAQSRSAAPSAPTLTPQVQKPTGPVVSPPLSDLAKQTMDAKPPSRYQPIEKLEHPELRYRLLEHFVHVQYCDRYSWPLALSDVPDALRAFPEIRKDQATFAAITQHLGLKGKTEFTDADKAKIYREYRKLRAAVRLEPAEAGYKFELGYLESESPSQMVEGYLVEGVIVPPDKITVLKKTPARLGCPI